MWKWISISIFTLRSEFSKNEFLKWNFTFWPSWATVLDIYIHFKCVPNRRLYIAIHISPESAKLIRFTSITLRNEGFINNTETLIRQLLDLFGKLYENIHYIIDNSLNTSRKWLRIECNQLDTLNNMMGQPIGVLSQVV